MRALALSTLLLLPGCAAAAGAGGAVGAGTVAYVGTDLEAVLEASPQLVVAASEAAFRDLEIRAISADATAIDGRVIGRTALDRKIEIHVEREGASSRISIRVDTFGDEALSRQIYERIKAHL